MPTGSGAARLFVGTSGWNYEGWREVFYPDDLAQRKWLSYYAERFNTAEVNYPFYHLPRTSTYENWRAATPPGFVFALKASRLITHIKRLRGVAAQWEEFVTRAQALGDKLGPVLLQFPPSFRQTAENLQLMEDLLGSCVGRPAFRIAAEFRHESCFGDKMLALLRRHDAALVISHSARYPVPEVVATASFVYFRFHGPRELFASSYSPAELRRWGARMRTFLKDGRDVYAYFNNDFEGYAPRNAASLVKAVNWRTA